MSSLAIISFLSKYYPIISTLLIAYCFFIFFVCYSWSCRQVRIVTMHPESTTIEKAIKSVRYTSYVFFTLFNAGLFFLTKFFNDDLILHTNKYWIGFVLTSVAILLSIFLWTWSIKSTGKASFSSLPSSTLFGGIYERMRHPQFIATVFQWIGIALFLNSKSVLVIVGVATIFLYFLVKNEEEGLIERFGKLYLFYKALVPMYWIRVKPSWDLNNEMRNLVDNYNEFVDDEAMNRQTPQPGPSDISSASLTPLEGRSNINVSRSRSTSGRRSVPVQREGEDPEVDALERSNELQQEQAMQVEDELPMPLTSDSRTTRSTSRRRSVSHIEREETTPSKANGSNENSEHDVEEDNGRKANVRRRPTRR
ncbi:uncharacterized protein MONOS_1139 [Monocercomonoides exilis]|uniref:uncharacterized protein n=1 Tax=Monocercomonoides exilis TaxID=2049356 RepID=UPI0035594D59|nr:hypothetical protein MONOS_1139 [Monocercomonoides exilis]